MRISEAKETIKRFKEKDKVIKKLFEFLDTIDSEVEQDVRNVSSKRGIESFIYAVCLPCQVFKYT